MAIRASPNLSPGEPTSLQPCSEACTCFRALPHSGWSDYGVCANPYSPRRGYPVRIGRDCPHYRTTPPRLPRFVPSDS